MAYLYRHIRLDKNEPFYIGIGNDDNYSRANFKHNRNKHWNNVVAKTNYEVEIILDNLSWDEAKTKEIEFILLYKRKDKCNGVLVNKTDGGDGCVGLIHTKEAREKMGIPNKGKKLSKKHLELLSFYGKNMTIETKNKISEKLKGRISWNKGIKNKGHSEFMFGKYVGENNKNSKLKESDVIKIKTLHLEHKLSSREIAILFNIGKTSVLNIINKKTWKHI